jgi:2-polyprenyl-3-methyl-5-hydroxy-6-metoxy-1,4-benzoquinol methylase
MNNSRVYYEGARKEVAQFLPGHYSKVLEIGCGEGGFHENLIQGSEHWGVEPVHAAANIASGKLYKVIPLCYQEAVEQIPNNYFDLIICNDVIEHMINHDEFFQSIKGKVTQSAYLVGSIPNVRYIGNLAKLLFMKDWKYEDEGILDRTHLRFFTEKSLKRLFHENGFTIEEFVGINEVEFKLTSPRMLLKNALTLLLGRDTRFLQFGFRIQYTGLS